MSRHQIPADDQTTAALEMIGHTGRAIILLEPSLRELVEAHERHQNIGALLHPTFFRQTMWSKTYAANIAIAKATLTYIAALKEWDAAHGEERERRASPEMAKDEGR